MTTRSLYPSGQPSQLAEGRQSYHPQTLLALKVGNQSRKAKLPNDPNILKPCVTLAQTAALERHCYR
ncbi:hypothetical protein H6F76_23240 [Leptolyngbya sp. FACHB-321]|uniref:hypothetical protein n=1 Tax=Leptolyngbya sp. FACHB-321 TaxID=2692807 RepID=UPI001682ADF4|nr:hypothetical protein [Leptolyngbya sp. FACHB-321]MBD2037872.1 hypothetical protein [Leptolyngbya sp. FACHB-321]